MSSRTRSQTAPLARALAVTALIAPVLACGGGSPTSPVLDLSSAVALPGGSTLAFQDGGALDGQRDRIEAITRTTLAAVRESLNLDGVTIIAFAGSLTVIPEIGMGGRADTGTVRLTFDPDSPVLAATLETDLFPLLAHELHHVARFRALGFADHLLDAMVTEGLADHFAVEVSSAPPALWAVALRGAELDEWLSRASETWLSGNYKHDAWFFGTGSIPRWAGYSVGYELVRRFLATNPSADAATLHDAPSTGFIPADSGTAKP